MRDLYFSQRLELFRAINFKFKVKDNKLYVNDVIVLEEGIPKIKDRNLKITIQRLGKSKRTLQSLADEYGLTKERIRQIQCDTLKNAKYQYINRILIERIGDA